MRWGIKIIVVFLLILIFFIVTVGLITVWTGQSNEAVEGVFDFLKNMGNWDPPKNP